MNTNSSLRSQISRPKSALLVLSLACLSLASIAQNVNAQIVTYVVTGANASTSTTISPTGAPGSITASSLTVGPNLTSALNQINSFALRTWSTSSSYSSGSGTYFDFQIQPNTGFTIDFTTIDYGLWHGSSGNAPKKFELHASTDAFASSDVNLTSGGVHDLTGINNTVTTFSDSASGLGTISAGTTVTFRVYGYSAVSTGAAGGFANGTAGVTGGADLVINGTVNAVPEPSTYAGIFGLLALGFVCVNRRLSKA